MRRVLILPLLAMPLVAACGTDGTGQPVDERRSAAGEVLGGEVSDAMIPLDTVKSTAPAENRRVPDATATAADAQRPAPQLPRPEMSGGPEPLPDDPSAEDAPSPPQPQ